MASGAIFVLSGLRLVARALRTAFRLALLAVPRDAPRPGENDVRAVYEILPCGRRSRVEPPGGAPGLLLWASQLALPWSLSRAAVAERSRRAQRRARALPEGLYLVCFENPSRRRDGSRYLVVGSPALMDEGGSVARAGYVGEHDISRTVRGIALHRGLTDADVCRIAGVPGGVPRLFLRTARMPGRKVASDDTDSGAPPAK
jgi:hypothetical protein